MSSAPTERQKPTMKIGSRLTLWGTACTVAICATVCVALYVGLNISLHDEVDRFLEGEVQEFLAILRDEGDEPFSKIEHDIREELGSRERKDLTFRLLDAGGARVLTSHENDPLPNPWPHFPAAGAVPSEIWFNTVNIDQPPMAIRTCGQVMDLPGRGPYIVQATYTLGTVHASLARFRNLCFGVMAFALVLSVIGGRILSRKSLRPVNAMATKARRIGTESISERLHRSNNGDELDQLASVLNEMLERLETQIRHIQQFTADAAHELRTPLAALRGNAEVALGTHANDADRRRALEDGIEEYDRLSRLTDDLLLLARADAGQDLLRRENISLEKTVRDVVDLYVPLALEKGVTLACSVESAEFVNADDGRIRQLISNLLDNAVKYSPRGGNVDITLTRRDNDAILTIEDDGCGIPSQHIPHVFDRFYRVDAARSRSTAGFGLGLAICRTIVEAHGGSITIQSNAGCGTKVICKLPAATQLQALARIDS